MTYVVKAKGAIQLRSLNNQVLMPGEEIIVEELDGELERAEKWGSIKITEVVEKKASTDKKWSPPKKAVEVPAETPKEVDETEPESEEDSEEETVEEPEEE